MSYEDKTWDEEYREFRLKHWKHRSPPRNNSATIDGSDPKNANLAPARVLAQRNDRCTNCPRYKSDTGFCRLNQALVSDYIRYRNSACPEGRWHSYIPSSQEQHMGTPPENQKDNV